jgi:diguanylate cyclase (GGDEF)-like protein
MNKAMDDDTSRENLDDLTLIVGQDGLPSPPPAERAVLVVLRGPEIGKRFDLPLGEHIIGRATDAAIYIPSSSVSRRHARVIRRREDAGSSIEVVDMGSSNGTRINNMPIQSARLVSGDKIQLGETVLKFVVEDPLEEAYHQEVHRRIHYDDLTGLLTLNALKNELGLALQTATEERPVVVAMTDLDGLKRVNDTHGHHAGSYTVRTMGEILRSVLRPQDRAGLFGGDETVIFFPATTLQEAVAIAENIRTAIEERDLELDGNHFRVTISQGLAVCPTHGRSVHQLIAAADGALYAAKAAGRNCIRCAEG